MRTPLFISAIFVLGGTSQADTMRVCPSGCIYSSIQDAIDASSDGDTIEIAAGTYYEHEVNPGGRAIIISGEINAGGSSAVIIDAQSKGRVLACDNGETSSTVFQNLVISGGQADFGGGMRNTNSDPTLTNCIFTNNTATNSGGAMYNHSSRPTMSGCLFENNVAINGGGMYNNEIQDNELVLIDCTFRTNSAAVFGGGIFNYSSNPALTSVVFDGNTAARGGGMYSGYPSSPILSDCEFTKNSAAEWGGGMFSGSADTTVMDSIFCANSPTDIHGAWSDQGGNEFNDQCEDCDGDFTGDGQVNVNDLLAVIAQWQDPYNVDDLLLVIAGWGACS